MKVRFVRLVPRSFQHAVGDKRKPTAYAVYYQNKLIGTVRSASQESWRKHGRIRTGFIGYGRWWDAYNTANQKVGIFHHTRDVAAKALLKEMGL